MDDSARIYIAGHRGLVGSALLRRCHAAGYANLVTRSHAELDLRDHRATAAFFERVRPEYVFLAAARVGGISANQAFPADFVYSNLMIETSVLQAAQQFGVKRLIFFGSTCAYPVHCHQPMTEESLLTGPLEPTSQPYAMAKLAGIELCKAFNRQYGTSFVVVIPCTLYGPNDNFDLRSSHVMSGLIRRFHEAKLTSGGVGDNGRIEPVAIWGSGTPRREFLYVDDLADACILLMNLSDDALASLLHPINGVVNIGSGADVTIGALAEMIRDVVGYQGGITFDRTKLDGAPRKLLDSSRISQTGWSPRVSLAQGIRVTYDWYCASAPLSAD